MWKLRLFGMYSLFAKALDVNNVLNISTKLSQSLFSLFRNANFKWCLINHCQCDNIPHNLKGGKIYLTLKVIDFDPQLSGPWLWACAGAQCLHREAPLEYSCWPQPIRALREGGQGRNPSEAHPRTCSLTIPHLPLVPKNAIKLWQPSSTHRRCPQFLRETTSSNGFPEGRKLP